MISIARQPFLRIAFFLMLANTTYAQSGWFPLKNGPHSTTFSNICFINPDTGFVKSAEGSWLTKDGGVTWSFFSVGGSKVKFFNHNRLGASFGESALAFSRDSGSSWVTQPGMDAYDVEFPSDSIGYLVTLGSDPFSVLLGRTKDGGKNWSYSPILTVTTGAKVVDVRALAFSDEKRGFVTMSAAMADGSGGWDGGYFTSDGGDTWSPRMSNFEIINLGGSTWLTTFINGAIVKSTDDFVLDSRQVDLNLRPKTADCSPEQHLCKFDSLTVSALSVRSGAIFRSTDGGETWYQQVCGLRGTNGWENGAISTPTRLVGYAVGLDGYIYKTTDGGGPPFTSVVMSSPNCNCGTTLTPNPASGYVRFSFDGVASSQAIEIYDAIGRHVSSAKIPAGSAEYRLDISTLPSGVYIAQLQSKAYRFVKFSE